MQSEQVNLIRKINGFIAADNHAVCNAVKYIGQAQGKYSFTVVKRQEQPHQ